MKKTLILMASLALVAGCHTNSSNKGGTGTSTTTTTSGTTTSTGTDTGTGTQPGTYQTNPAWSNTNSPSTNPQY